MKRFLPLLLLLAAPASADIAHRLAVDEGVEVYHSIIVHCENNLPVQYEDRWVNPPVTPSASLTDFTEGGPSIPRNRRVRELLKELPASSCDTDKGSHPVKSFQQLSATLIIAYKPTTWFNPFPGPTVLATCH